MDEIPQTPRDPPGSGGHKQSKGEEKEERKERGMRAGKGRRIDGQDASKQNSKTANTTASSPQLAHSSPSSPSSPPPSTYHNREDGMRSRAFCIHQGCSDLVRDVVTKQATTSSRGSLQIGFSFQQASPVVTGHLNASNNTIPHGDPSASTPAHSPCGSEQCAG
eukprot:745622-Hanusia_phi.AAC.6